MSDAYKSKILDLLLNAGWFPGRNIDVSPEVTLYRNNKFDVHESFINFMAEYGNLSLIRGDYEINTICTTDEYGLDYFEFLRRINSITGDEFLFIGMSNSIYDYVINKKGQFFYIILGSDVEARMVYLGESVYEFFVNALSGKEGGVTVVKY